MENRINKKIEQYVDNLKKDVVNHMSYITNDDTVDENMKTNSIASYINNYDLLQLTKSDFMKRKRNKNSIPVYMRCSACRASGEQCSRKRKDESEYCGTHEKNRPHGVIDITSKKNELKRVEIWLQEINGIIYYIDGNGNIYNTEDILQNKINPKIVDNYKINDQGYYTIS
tara:strand:+ start:1606 stop:2118 length:513 start_codon:yes stop_codon:yes gene_type:complete